MQPARPAPKHASDITILKSLAMVTIAVAALYFGRDLLIPLALALLLSFLLTTPVGWLEKLRLGRVPAVIAVLVAAFSVCGAIAWLGVNQLADIATNAPVYQENLHRKIEAMRNPAGSALTKALASLQELRGELTAANDAAASTTATKDRLRIKGPLQVEIVRRPPGLLGSIGFLGSSLVHLLADAGAVLIFALFMLIQRGDLRNRFIQLVGTGHLNATTAALDDAATGITRYLFTELIINTVFGLLLGGGLFCIGVPNAFFWGALGTILRFIPYVGTLVAGFCPLVLALAALDGWARPLLTLGLFGGIELMMSAAIEPWLYGVHTGISSLAILVSAAFWTLLWGPVGLVLSTPLTVCLLVLGRHVPALQFLRVALGEKVELPLEACYYQRLLAMDDEDAQQIAETYLKERTAAELFDFVLIPALGMAEHDRHANTLDEEREKFICQSVRLLLEDLSEEEAPEADELSSHPVMACIPARDEADELVGLMLAHSLQVAGQKVEAIALGPRTEMFRTLKERQIEVLIVSALPPFALMQARSLCRKAHRRFPELKIVLGLWGADIDIEQIKKRVGLECFDSVVTTIRQAETALASPGSVTEELALNG